MSENKTTGLEAGKNITDKVMARIQAMESDGSLMLPKDYAVTNHLKSAWLILQDVKTKDNKPVLEACTQVSIANALLDMVTKNLSVSKKQAYFIARGDKLCLDVSYFGNIANAKRHGLKRDPDATLIYAGDIFVYEIVKGKINILKHEQKLENIDNNKIIGAYAVGELEDGTIKTVVKTMTQIKTAWSMGSSYGKSPAHTKFPDQMAIRTVLNALCKIINASSNDAYLYDDLADANDDANESIIDKRQALIDEVNTEVEETIYEEVKTEQEQLPAQEQPQELPPEPAKPQPISGF